KMLVAWRFNDNLRVGVEARAQSEIHDEDGWKGPQMLMTDIRGGPTLVWRIAKPVSFQVLVGVAKPVEVTSAGFLALRALAFDLERGAARGRGGSARSPSSGRSRWLPSGLRTRTDPFAASRGPAATR